MAVPHTSPSPCAAWVSPTENSAPATSTGRNNSVPCARSRISILPPTRRGGTTLCNPGSAGATPMVPVKGFSGTLPHRPNNAGARVVASYCHRCSAGSLKSSANSPKPGIFAVHPQPEGANDSKRHLQDVPGGGAFDEHRPRDRIGLGEVQTVHIGGRRGRDTAGRRMRRPPRIPATRSARRGTPGSGCCPSRSDVDESYVGASSVPPISRSPSSRAHCTESHPCRASPRSRPRSRGKRASNTLVRSTIVNSSARPATHVATGIRLSGAIAPGADHQGSGDLRDDLHGADRSLRGIRVRLERRQGHGAARVSAGSFRHVLHRAELCGHVARVSAGRIRVHLRAARIARDRRVSSPAG